MMHKLTEEQQTIGQQQQQVNQRLQTTTRHILARESETEELRREQAALQGALVALSKQQAIRSAAMADMALSATAQTENDELEAQVAQTLAQHPDLLPANMNDSSMLLDEMSQQDAREMDEKKKNALLRPSSLHSIRGRGEGGEEESIPKTSALPNPAPASAPASSAPPTSQCNVNIYILDNRKEDDEEDSLFAHISSSESDEDEEDEDEDEEDDEQGKRMSRRTQSPLPSSIVGHAETIEEDHDIPPVWSAEDNDDGADDESNAIMGEGEDNSIDGCDSD
jgi:hypothetical protein